MKTIICLLLFCACSISVYGQDKVKLKILKNKPILQANLNGKVAYFLIDTGSEITILHSKAEKWYDFNCFYSDKSRFLNSLSTGNLILYNANNVQLMIGEKKIKANFFAYDLSQVIGIIKNTSGVKICGIIGGDIMQSYDFVINYKEKQLVINK